MKRRNLLLIPLTGLLVLTSLFSCGVDRWKEYYPLTGRDLWIDSVMRQDYLWYMDIPPSKDLNYFKEPADFLKSELSKLDKGFSTVDTLDNTPVLSYGFDYTLYKVATSDTTYNALISYVIPDSPASQAGLERGEWIMLIDGDSITKKTEEWLAEGGSRKLRIGKYTFQEVDNGEEDEDGEKQKVGVVLEDRDVELPAARVVTDNAVHAEKIFQLEGTGQTVAYLAYNAFSPGPHAGSQEYNNELRRFSQQCKQAGVNNFVLDLRYNAGGDMECVQLLGDIVVPADKLESPLAFLKYNDKQSMKDRDLILDSQLLKGGANLNLNTLYVITTHTTAGAGEMLVNCLRPYMNVVLVGEATKGEYVATETYLNPQYPWVLRPVVCEVLNIEEKADYENGFQPDLSVNQYAYPQAVLPLGNPDEIMLNTVLNIIAGNIELPKKEPATQMTAVKSFSVKRSFRKGLIVK